MNLCCRKGHYLVFQHQIKLDLNSGFEFQNKFIFVNKHKIIKVHGENPTIKINPEKAKFYCERCLASYLFKNTYVYCENCGKLMAQRLSKKMGDSLLICKPCYKQAKTYRAFDIFKLLTSTASQLNEINVDSFHEYSWEEVLQRFSGEELSPAPENIENFIGEQRARSIPEEIDEPGPGIRFTEAVEGIQSFRLNTNAPSLGALVEEDDLEERGMQDNTE